jgi:NAD(P)-dependent dehydrogenase (short-subunit alcohol dehydrogenase family)
MAQEQITPKIDFATALVDLFSLEGKVAYIPGGYGGIGEAIAWGLAMQGARVVVSGRDSTKAEILAKNLSNKGFEARACSLDAHSVSEIRDSVDFVIEQYGAIDILVNCVGMQREEAILDVSEEAFDELYTVNLKAAMFLAQATAKHQIQAGQGGKHIHLLSVRSQLGLRDRGYSAYCSTKGALVMLTKQHAMELAPHQITVNGIAPTFVFTEMIRHVMDNPEFKAGLENRIPLGRIADPKDIVGAALFFASPAASFITGQVLYVDGGITASQ